MAMQSTFVRPIDGALDREIDSRYDDIRKVSKVADAINRIAGEDSTTVDAIVKLAGNAEDLQTVTDGAKMINGLTAEAETVPSEGGATAEVKDGKILIGVPKGNTGPAGDDGMTPNIKLIYNGLTGELGYEVVGYLEAKDLPGEEI